MRDDQEAAKKLEAATAEKEASCRDDSDNNNDKKKLVWRMDHFLFLTIWEIQLYNLSGSCDSRVPSENNDK